MSDYWTHRNGPVTLSIHREALGFVLSNFDVELNQLAESVAAEARAVLPMSSMRRFIGVLRGGVIEGKNIGVWRLKLRGRHYGSGVGERLMRGIEVPIALVTNNSNLALTWEYGELAQKAIAFVRKDGGSTVAVGSPERGTREAYFRQYQPLTLGAQRAGARFVAKRRR